MGAAAADRQRHEHQRAGGSQRRKPRHPLEVLAAIVSGTSAPVGAPSERPGQDAAEQREHAASRDHADRGTGGFDGSCASAGII